MGQVVTTPTYNPKFTMTNCGSARAYARRPKNSPTQTRTNSDPRSPVCPNHPLTKGLWQRSARSVRGNSNSGLVTTHPSPRNTRSRPKQCVFARRRRSSRTRRCWTRSERSTSTCRMRSFQRSCARHGTNTPETSESRSET